MKPNVDLTSERDFGTQFTLQFKPAIFKEFFNEFDDIKPPTRDIIENTDSFIEFFQDHCECCGKYLIPWKRINCLCEQCNEVLNRESGVLSSDEFSTDLSLIKSKINYIFDKIVMNNKKEILVY